MKTKDLIGTALDWAVAKCEKTQGWKPYYPDPLDGYGSGPVYTPYAYSTDWAHGGPIIERHKINLHSQQARNLPKWTADDPMRSYEGAGETPLTAAMRLYVASELGDEIDLPAELSSENGA